MIYLCLIIFLYLLCLSKSHQGREEEMLRPLDNNIQVDKCHLSHHQRALKPLPLQNNNIL